MQNKKNEYFCNKISSLYYNTEKNDLQFNYTHELNDIFSKIIHIIDQFFIFNAFSILLIFYLIYNLFI